MADYKIITESTADLPDELVKKLEVEVIPMEFIFGDYVYHDYPDAHEMSSEEFYGRLATGEMSKTNQVNTITFIEAFEPWLAQGMDVLLIGFSSALSGTHARALEAAAELRAKYPERKIVTVDTLTATLAQGLLVYYAALKRQAGARIEEVADWVNIHKFKVSMWFTVDDLNHLKRGGRVSGATALVGTVLGIKPILQITDEGHLVPREKVRGRKQSLDNLVSRLARTVQEPEKQTLFLVHANVPEDAKYVIKQVKSHCKFKDIVVNNLGPVIGTHTGNGALAMFYFAGSRG